MIREASPADFAAIVELFHELGVDDPPPTEATWIADTMPHTLVFERDGSVIGYASFRTLTSVGHVHNLVVSPSARGQHVGSALMREVARRIRARGLAEWHLNVKADNTAAIRLYEHLGLEAEYRSHAFRVTWAQIAALPETVATVTPVTDADDADLERRFQIVAGRLRTARTRPNRFALQLRDPDGLPLGVACFDPAHPGVFPFAVAQPALAGRLLRAMQPHARPEHDFLQVIVERDPGCAQLLRDAGGELRLDLVHFRGAL
jgi:N-acetylglutamate synthase-like GNAT family acetyltransferase